MQRQVLTGVLVEGDALPSVRSVAAELTINPMTVSKAYSQLEQAGVLFRRPGVGMMVAPQSQSAEQALAPDVQRLVQMARELSLSRDQVLALLSKQWEELP